MEDLGAPSSYLALSEGTDVYSSDGERIGSVGEVRADEQKDIFDGLVISRGVLPPRSCFVLADQVEQIHERGVVLNLDAEAAERLPDPD